MTPVVLIGALLLGGLVFESWSRRADLREQSEAFARALEVQQESLRADLGRRLAESIDRVDATGSRLDRELAKQGTEHDSFRDSTLRKMVLLNEGEEALRARLARLDRRSDRSVQEIESMRGALLLLEDGVRTNRPEAARFKEIQRQNAESIFFIYSEISLVNSTGSIESTIGSYGTGFLVSDEGHIATSKHVAQPWKFREFARQIARRGLEIDPDSHLIAAWPAGSPILDPDGDCLNLDIGFNNLRLQSLEVWATASDRFKSEVLENDAGEVVEVRYHDANDNHDLAILKAEGGPFRPVRTVSGRLPEKLDPVMVLGFPRGLDILEKGVAESSPSLGTVRKVEDTIYVTAPIIPGNSGGPVFDREGAVIGIATRVVQGTETLGICLKADHFLKLLHSGQPTAQRSGKGPNVTLTTR